ncbi:hypothetical protein ACUUL3_00380 [Thiovibrio sp. JS02]
MHRQDCPFCREKIHPLARVCRYCKRELPRLAPPRGKKGSHWLAALLAAGVIVGSAAVVAAEFLRERKNWLK